MLDAVRLTGQAINPDVVWFEDSPHPEIVGLSDGVVLVIMTAGTLDGRPQESTRGVLDRHLDPFVSIKSFPVACQKASRS